MKTKEDSPGAPFPPPLIYALTFLLSILLERLFYLSSAILHTTALKYIGGAFILIALLLSVPAIRQFVKSKNTLAPIRPANSLQTTGIYATTRNPMYLGLLCLYIGLIPLLGNLWTLILVIIVILIVTAAVIKPEERYLERRFGQSYAAYKLKARRWV
ncbi:MAG TPA: isoprenylcysteine carboxylmethyltransferase family protein [Mucilaginibacter sp.]|jgi:protein-S-isoprenylcysteine O-methyltransferase Ste14